MGEGFHHQSAHSQIKAAPYNYPHDASLGPDTTALVIIDMQRDCKRAHALDLECHFERAMGLRALSSIIMYSLRSRRVL